MRRSLYLAAVVLIVLPIVTFGMAYLIVDVPSRATSAPTRSRPSLASDGSELAKIVPPEGNRVDVNIDQVPVHVRNAVMAAEDRDFTPIRAFAVGLRPRHQEQPLRRRPAGWLDDHPAIRQERARR